MRINARFKTKIHFHFLAERPDMSIGHENSYTYNTFERKSGGCQNVYDTSGKYFIGVF